MKKSLTALFFALGAACALNGAIVKNPDANTLWKETGTEMKFHPENPYTGSWVTKRCTYIPEKDGFVMVPKVGDKAYAEIVLPFDREYPYLEFDLEPLEKTRNYYFLVHVTNIGPWYTLTDGAKAGHYVVNVFENTNEKKMPKTKGNVHLQFRVYAGKVRIKNLRMVKKPYVPLEIKCMWFDHKKYFSYEACLEFMVPDEKKNKRPVRMRFSEYGGKEIEVNNDPYVELRKIQGYPGKLASTFTVETFTRKKISAGGILVELEGYEKPVFSWIPYMWDPGMVRDKAKSIPNDYKWIKDLRTDHPRFFVNKETLPKMKAWAEKIGYKQILADADNFKVDPKLMRKTRGAVGDKRPYETKPVMIPLKYEEEALTCALAYLLTGDKKYADKTWTFLDHNLMVYQTCAKARTAIDWYGLGRIENMAALDWIWNASDPARCKKYMKDFVDVNIQYARHGWYGPFEGINGGAGGGSGFYGDANTELFMGLLAYKEGVCDELALDMLEKGYEKYSRTLNFRDTGAEDDGILSTYCIGYSGGQYPWVSYDFLFFWRAAFQKPVPLPKLTHLLYYAEWFQWNMLPGKGNIPIRQYGIGDNEKSDMRLFGIGGHLYIILGIYGTSFPEESKEIAKAIARMNGKYDPNCFAEKGKIYKRNKAPKYHWGFHRPYLCYDMDAVKIPAIQNEKNGKPKVLARHFPTGGLLFMRSGLEKDSTYALFNIGGVLGGHKTRGDENHFGIFHKGFLAIDSGYRDDTWYAPVKYHRSSVAHNTMLIHDPSEKFPGDEKEIRAKFKHFYHCWADTKEQDEFFKKHEPYFADAQGSQDKDCGGKCRAFSTNDFYTYIAGDATFVYNSAKCKEFNRQFIHVQPDTFVVFDRVESIKPEFKKEWLLHFLEEPVVTGNQTVAKVSDEGGIIRCTTLLPKGGVITKIGGPGKEFFGTNTNWVAPQKFLKKIKYGGKWRIALSPAKPAKRDYFLNVIDVGDKAVTDIRSEENENEAKVSFVTPDKRKVSITFGKDGKLSGAIRIEKDGKVLCEEKLTNRVQKQSGFLY